jgi:hypothetical protein
MIPETGVSSATEPMAFVNERQVKVIVDVLRALMDRERPTPAKWDDPRFWNVEATDADRCQYLAVGNSINFRFWEQADGKTVPAIGAIDGEALRGSMYMWRRLRIAVDRGELALDALFLSDLDEATLARAFTDDDGRLPLGAGIGERVLNLRDLGARLASKWHGQFVNVIRAANGSLKYFAELCADFRAFDDPVQKLTMVNAIMLAGSGLARFDQDPLPGIDYHLVKQALRQGLVTPSHTLQAKLTNHELLDEGESVALRTAILTALIEVSQLAGISTAVIDNLYWLNRRICGDEEWLCSSCPFEAGCAKRTEFGLPLELTRYY